MKRRPTTFIGVFPNEDDPFQPFPGFDLTFDATMQEDAQYSATLTKNPIESGAEVNDHFFLAPRTLTLSIFVSNTPFDPKSTDLVTIANQNAGLASSAGSERRIAGLEILKKLQAIARPFSVQTGLDLFNNMLIIDLKTTDNAESRGELAAVVTMQEAIFTEAENFKLVREVLPPEMKPQAEIKEKGKAQEDAKRKSLAAAAYDKLLGDSENG